MIDYILVRRGEGLRPRGFEAVYVGMQHKLVAGEFNINNMDGGKGKRVL